MLPLGYAPGVGLRSRLGSLVLAGGSLLLAASSARAGDTWTTPYDGVRHLHRTTSTPWNIHVLVVDLATPGVHFEATKTDQRKHTTSAFAKLVSAQAAINGDLFSYTDYSTSGLAAGANAQWTDTKDTTTEGNAAFDKETSRFEIHAPSEVLAFDKTWMEGVVSGRPLLVSGGTVPASFSTYGAFCTGRNPRTMVGVSKDGTTVYLAVVDGRSTSSVGMTCAEEGTFMKGLGAWTALNFDGGGSSTMYVAGLGVVNVPSDGSERVVGNHLALFAPKSGTVGTLKGTVYETPTLAKKITGATVSIAGVGSDVSDAAGAWEILVEPGTYALEASKSGYVPSTVSKTVAAGATVTLDIGLAVSTVPTDGDGDGVPDGKDDCPDVANADQRDTDHDGIGDACDADDDNDGVFDEDDDCPLFYDPDQKDANHDGIGDACEGADAATGPGPTFDATAGDAANADASNGEGAGGCGCGVAGDDTLDPFVLAMGASVCAFLVRMRRRR